MRKEGFTFLELIIGVTIASILSIVLFMAYNQTHRSSRNLDKIIEIDSKVSVIQNQFERDISGIFVPDITEIKPEVEKKQKEEKEKTNKETKENKEAKESKAIKEEKEKKEKVEAKRKLPEKTFYGENKGKILNELTFITSNPLQVYGESKPRISRVTYRLKEDKLSKGSYALYRQESSELNYGAEKDSVEYEVVNGIKDLAIDYITPEPEKEIKEEKEAKEKKEKEIKYKIFNEWKFEGEKNKKENPFIVPLLMNIKITFWEDTEHTLEQKFEFKYFIYAFNSQFPKKKKADEKLEKIFKGIESLRKEAGIKSATEAIPNNNKRKDENKK